MSLEKRYLCNQVVRTYHQCKLVKRYADIITKKLGQSPAEEDWSDIMKNLVITTNKSVDILRDLIEGFNTNPMSITKNSQLITIIETKKEYVFLKKRNPTLPLNDTADILVDIISKEPECKIQLKRGKTEKKTSRPILNRQSRPTIHTATKGLIKMVFEEDISANRFHEMIASLMEPYVGQRIYKLISGVEKCSINDDMCYIVKLKKGTKMKILTYQTNTNLRFFIEDLVSWLYNDGML